MAQTIGSLDLNAFSDLYSDSTQYFWFEGNASATYGAGAHVTLVPDTSFISNPTGQNILMNTDGFSIRNGLLPMMTLDNDSLDFNIVDTIAGTYTNVASFGASSTIGVTDGTESYMILDFHSLQMKDKEGNPYFYVSDLRGSDGTATITERFYGDGYTREFNLSVRATNTTYSVYGGGGISYTRYTTGVYFDSAVGLGTEVRVVYKTESTLAKVFTLGIRNGDAGVCSFAEGESEASGAFSHAENASVAVGKYSHAEGTSKTGADNVAGEDRWFIGNYAHAEGNNTLACAFASHSEGFNSEAVGKYSHAEGEETYALSDGAHSEGSVAIARASYSHAQNLQTIASSEAQTTMGKYNIEDANNKYALIIGNGTADDARSNALTVEWNGNVKVAGNFYATDHTNPIGWYDAHNNTTTLSNGTSFVKLNNSDITLAAGRYIITGSVRFNGATSGYRGITIQDSNGSIARANVTQQTIPSSSWTTSLNTTIIYIAQSQTTVSLMAYQNSGSSLGISWDIYAICIK